MKTGNRIRLLRDIKGFKQAFVAEGLGISPAAYSKIERDETEISYNQLLKILEILEVDMQTFEELGKNGIYVSANNSENCGIITIEGNFEQNFANKQEVEKLQMEIQFLKAENDYLKKIIGLMENENKMDL